MRVINSRNKLLHIFLKFRKYSRIERILEIIRSLRNYEMFPRKNYHIGHKKWSNNVTIIQIDFLKNDVSEYHQLCTYRGYRKRCLHLDLHVIYIFAVSKMRFSSFTYNVSHLSQANAFVAIIVQF